LPRLWVQPPRPEARGGQAGIQWRDGAPQNSSDQVAHGWQSLRRNQCGLARDRIWAAGAEAQAGTGRKKRAAAARGGMASPRITNHACRRGSSSTPAEGSARPAKKTSIKSLDGESRTSTAQKPAHSLSRLRTHTHKKWGRTPGITKNKIEREQGEALEKIKP